MSRKEDLDLEVDEGDENMIISRGLQPETDELDITKVSELKVVDQDGFEIRFDDLYEKQKTIIIFVRHFLCFTCKEYVDDLAMIPQKYLDDADVRLVVIGCAPNKFIQPFRKTTNYRYDLYVDPDRAIYKGLRWSDVMKTGNLKASKHVKSGSLMGVLKSTWRGMAYQEYQGDVNQLGGAMIMGPGNTLSYFHRDKSAADHAPINDLLRLAGVQQMNFEKDNRIIDI